MRVGWVVFSCSGMDLRAPPKLRSVLSHHSTLSFARPFEVSQTKISSSLLFPCSCVRRGSFLKGAAREGALEAWARISTTNRRQRSPGQSPKKSASGLQFPARMQCARPIQIPSRTTSFPNHSETIRGLGRNGLRYQHSGNLESRPRVCSALSSRSALPFLFA